jgi:hypothetical protein
MIFKRMLWFICYSSCVDKIENRARRLHALKVPEHDEIATSITITPWDQHMTIVSLHPVSGLTDARQSEKALLVRKGVQILLNDMGHSVLAELSLSSGRRADLISISPKGEIWIIEIKSSIEDFRVDKKWPDYRPHCDRLFFASHSGVPAEIFPLDCGLMISDGYGAHMLRDAPEHRLAPPARKAIMLHYAKTAARRLMKAEWSVGRSFED